MADTAVRPCPLTASGRIDPIPGVPVPDALPWDPETRVAWLMSLPVEDRHAVSARVRCGEHGTHLADWLMRRTRATAPAPGDVYPPQVPSGFVRDDYWPGFTAPVWHRGGVPWWDATPARTWLRRHRHETQTVGCIDGEWSERCACGATRFDLDGSWVEERHP